MSIKRKILILFFFPSLICSCAILPWETWRYIDASELSRNANFRYINDIEKYSSVSVEGVSVSAKVRANNENRYMSSAPYLMEIGMYTNKVNSRKVRITKIRVDSSIDAKHPISLNLVKDDEKSGDLPIEVTFQKIEKKSKDDAVKMKYEAYFVTNADIDLKPAQGEQITVTVGLEVTEGKKNITKKEIQYSFRPEVKRGSVQFPQLFRRK